MYCVCIIDSPCDADFERTPNLETLENSDGTEFQAQHSISLNSILNAWCRVYLAACSTFNMAQSV